MIKRSVKQKQNGAVCYPEPYAFFSLTLIFFYYSVGILGLGPEKPP